MNKSKLMLGLLCLTAVASLSRVAMTQENDFGTILEPLSNDESLPQSEDHPLFDDRPIEPSSSRGRNQLVPNANAPRFDDPGQPQLNRPDVRSNRATAPRVMRPRQRSRTVLETVMEVVPPEEVAENRKLQAAINSLKTSKSDSEKKKAANIISAQLKFQFERDLKQREEELAKVEERVRSLREQLDKRRSAQADIISLRLQTLVNEASGLGFPTNSLGSTPNFPVGSPFNSGLDQLGVDGTFYEPGRIDTDRTERPSTKEFRRDIDNPRSSFSTR